MPRNSASAIPSAWASQPGPLSSERGQQHERAEPERRRHHRLGRVPGGQQPLGGERVDRVRPAGRDGERDAGRRYVGVAAGQREQRDARAGQRGRDRPAGPEGRRRSTIHSNRPVSVGAEPSATIVPTATPVSATAAKNASW